MTSIFDVAAYVLDKLGVMTTMKLEKLCYYSQAWSLVWDERRLFPERFEHGPTARCAPTYTMRTRACSRSRAAIFTATRRT